MLRHPSNLLTGVDHSPIRQNTDMLRVSPQTKADNITGQPAIHRNKACLFCRFTQPVALRKPWIIQDIKTRKIQPVTDPYNQTDAIKAGGRLSPLMSKRCPQRLSRQHNNLST